MIMHPFLALAIAACALSMAIVPAGSATLSKTYSYFAINGTTLEELQRELATRGPKVANSGERHPGATRMEFVTSVGYEQGKRGCRVSKATVRVKASVILPRWHRRKGAGPDVQLIWDTLSADIKRHEESHVSIAKNHARQLENELLALWPKRTCDLMAAQVKATRDRILKLHDQEQERFDRIENKTFEKRLLRLIRYRMERTATGR